MSSFTHDNAFAFQTKVHLFASHSRHITLNSALQRAFKAFQQCLLDNKGINFIWSIDAIMLSLSTTKWNSKKRTNLANKQATYQTSLFPMTDRKSTILNSFLIRPTYQISHFGKTQLSVDLVFKTQSHELRMHSHFPRLHDKALSLWVKDTLRQKHALALCTERK